MADLYCSDHDYLYSEEPCPVCDCVRLRKGIGDLAFWLERIGMSAQAGGLLLWRDGQIQALKFTEAPR